MAGKDVKDERSGSVSTFLQKVLAMVEEPESSELVSWTPNGESFRVYDPVPFAKEVLPRFFKHCNFSSFVRQLNMYDFHKVMEVQSGALSTGRSKEWEFVHPNFKRGQPQLLSLVKRKAGTTESSKPKSESIKRVMNEVQAMQEQQEVVSQKLEHLDTDNRILWNEMVKLKNRHQQQQQTINRILYFLSSIYSSDSLPGTLRDGDDALTLQSGQSQSLQNSANLQSLRVNSMQQPSSYANIATEPLIDYGAVSSVPNGSGIMSLGNGSALGSTFTGLQTDQSYNNIRNSLNPSPSSSISQQQSIPQSTVIGQTSPFGETQNIGVGGGLNRSTGRGQNPGLVTQKGGLGQPNNYGSGSLGGYQEGTNLNYQDFSLPGMGLPDVKP
eukprot:CFRG3163T1